MTTLQRNIFIFLIIFSQTALAAAGGLIVLFLTARTYIPPKVYVGDLNVGKMTRQAAAAEIEKHYDSTIKDKILTIKYNANESFNIKYNEIGARLDVEATVGSAYGKGIETRFINILKGSFFSQNTVIKPEIIIDEVKAREKLKEFSLLVNREPVNARVYLKDEKVVKEAEINGLILDIDMFLERLKGEICNYTDELLLGVSGGIGIEVVKPEFTIESFDGADVVISSFSTDILSPEEYNSIRTAVSAINRVLIYPADVKKGEETGVFSFNKYMEAAKGLMEKNNEGYNQVASTLYAAVLNAGIDTNAITRTKHATPVDYIEPGLDAYVFGDTVDFKFKNTLDSKLIIFASVKDNKITINLVGKKQESTVNASLKSEIEQKYEPSVINVESQELRPGQKKLISPGKEGVKVSIYRIIRKGETEIRRLIYSEKYDAEDAMVQVGPNTRWDNATFK